MLTAIRPWKRAFILLCGLSLLMVPMAASASTSKTPSNNKLVSTSTVDQAVTQGYGTDSPLQQGMIVELKKGDSSKVVPLVSKDATKMQGVIVAANDAALTLSSDANSGQVYVASFGHYDVLVSNQNGPIKTGDYITISALAGVGMKVDDTQPTVLGKAAADFSGSNNIAGTAKLKDSSGHEVSVSIGRIPVDVSISHNPLQQTSEKNVPGFLKQVAQSVANKSVAATRIYLALVVLAVDAFVAGNMLYSGIRGGLIAIGRNPLAKKSIIAGIVRVVLMGLIVFIIGLFGVYLLLKL